MTKTENIVDCMTLAREMVSQPELLREFFPESQPAAQSVQRYTGARSTLDEQRLLRVGAMRLLGASDREIEAACHVTRRSIPILLVELERSGRLTPLKERLSTLTGDNAERANLALRTLLDRAASGEESLDLAAMIKSVATALGIVTDKWLVSIGSATEILEVRVGGGRADTEAWCRQNAIPVEIIRPANDLESPSIPDVSTRAMSLSESRHVMDTDACSVSATSSAPRPPDASPARGEGGGPQFGTGPETPMVQDGSKF